MSVTKKIAALVLSLLVHGFTLVLIVSGVWIVYGNSDFVVAWLLGGLLVAIGGLLFPRPRRLGGDAELVARSSAPELYGVARRVAEAMGVLPPEAVAVRDLTITGEYVRVGWRRRPVLVIGLPVWLVLSARRRVVLLTRTYADRSDDNLMVSGALWTLAQWRESLMSGKPLARRAETHIYMATVLGSAAPRGGYEAAGTLGQVLGKVLGWPALLMERALLGLTRMPDGPGSRRRPAAPVHGVVTDAEMAWLDELMDGRRFVAPLQAAVLRGATVAEIRASMPAREGDLGEEASTGSDDGSLLTPAASDVIDAELSAHYARAMRAFGLIW
ncbi:hypothetical protein DQ384_20990 [Sphaerisporangium album]|uniref:Peptidase M48 domain-containing protein n=1 Tax=Sphaerisporangium album TaxID=509200 RepID=A0A367FHX7_9ACTN|nr:hypothetical protein [Sphaerisporangium album]RCG29509.1 hypothetical protein DQ384_20990 [Sphaerisporangium album]